MTTCPFCGAADGDFFLAGPLVRALWDRFPVSPGHALVVTRRHAKNWFDATVDEQRALVDAVAAVRTEIERTHQPDGYNIGVNVSAAAGQTVPHLHLHVIPRYVGDVADPRGGVRGVIPQKANYLAAQRSGQTPHDGSVIRGVDDPLQAHLAAHLGDATGVDIAVAFTMESGVRLLEEYLRDVLARGGRVRLVTGDYLGITDPDALVRLLDLGEHAELRVYESGNKSFHPKSYIIHARDDAGTAFVGSSNLSKSALVDGVEWNYRVVTSRDRDGFRDVCAAFDALFTDPRTRTLDAEWITAYRARRRVQPPVVTGVPAEQPQPAPVPNGVQREALEALRLTRAAGNAAGLVVLATGLGKTWLSAFDSEQAKAKRLLFVAHREEILDQAMRTFRTIRPNALLGKYTGTEKSEGMDVLFASIQTLGQRRHLNQFPADHFDYVVVDEFHHASANTYRRLLDHFTPEFLLGLTATPERSDGADLLSLCGGNLVYRCDLPEGVRRELLAPFDYYGVPDEVDYANIPWRSNRFDEEALTTAVATTSRAENALDQLKRRGGTRTIAFCVSQRHADFMRQFFLGSGLRAAAVHAGTTSDPRTQSLERLQAGELDVLCAVDMFNEGVDIPDVDSLLMLRPTESQILWLQQFGRGLRVRPGKRLKVIDYIGNHRSFLLKPRTLFQLGAGETDLTYALRLLDEGRGAEMLPPGCSVTYDLEAKEILRALLAPTDRREAFTAYYESFRERNGARPTASETFNDGFDPKSARTASGSWFQFVRSQHDLTDQQQEAEAAIRPFLTQLEVTPMAKSYKMLVLLAMIAEGAFPSAVSIDRLVARVALIARRSSMLRTELGDAIDDDTALRTLLEENPIAAWVGGRGTGGSQFFAYDGSTFSTTFTVPSRLVADAADLARELAEWRLAVYIRRSGNVEGAPRLVCRVSHTNGRPLIFLPSRDRVAGVPEGWVDVTADGERYQADFVKIAVNVMTHAESTQNVLPDLLHKWFGPGAGLPGTTHSVVFERTAEGFTLAPAGERAERGPQLWARYVRADVPKLFGFEFKGFESQSGIVVRPGLMLLFVTLEKASMVEAHKYRDEFLSPTEFQWQTQNRTTPASAIGQAISGNVTPATAIHLFVRPSAKSGGKTQSFTYCGTLDFQRWDITEKPITVWWKLRDAVPPSERQLLRVPQEQR